MEQSQLGKGLNLGRPKQVIPLGEPGWGSSSSCGHCDASLNRDPKAAQISDHSRSTTGHLSTHTKSPHGPCGAVPTRGKDGRTWGGGWMWGKKGTCNWGYIKEKQQQLAEATPHQTSVCAGVPPASAPPICRGRGRKVGWKHSQLGLILKFLLQQLGIRLHRQQGGDGHRAERGSVWHQLQPLHVRSHPLLRWQLPAYLEEWCDGSLHEVPLSCQRHWSTQSAEGWSVCRGMIRPKNMPSRANR